MYMGEDAVSMPMDVTLDIFSRLPTKSICRFHCVSKVWRSMLCCSDFIDLFHTRYSSNPRLLIGIVQGGEWFFYSTPQPKNTKEESSLVVNADFLMKFSKDLSLDGCIYASGLTYFSSMRIKDDDDAMRVICNPSTAQYAILPILPPTVTVGELPEWRTDRNWGGFLGFDPIGKQFKVLFMNSVMVDKKMVHRILTLGTKKVMWRNIQCPLSHGVRHNGEICINGILYYIGYKIDDGSHLIVCFDVRYEKFEFLMIQNAKYFCDGYTKLVSYKGKLGVINLKYRDYHYGNIPLKLSMRVLNDFEKREWSRYVYTVKAGNKVIKVNYNLFVVGVTATGEIVLANKNACKPFYVFYINPQRNTLLKVEIQGVGNDHECLTNHRVYAFVDHVENLHATAI